MKTRRVFLLAGLLNLAIFLSCGDDTPTAPKKKTTTDVWPSLEEKDDVLEYLSLVYNRRNFSRYAKLLDEYFTFRFGDDDYNSGRTDRDWGRTAELGSANKLLNGYSTPVYGAVVEIELKLFPQGQIWTEILKNDPPYAGETWYQKSINYNLTVSTNNGTELRGNYIQAFFIVRQSEVEGKNIWRIVQWTDDTGLGFLRLTRDPQPSENTTWGLIKSLY